MARAASWDLRIRAIEQPLPSQPAVPEPTEDPAATPAGALRGVALAVGNWTDADLGEAVERATGLSAGTAVESLRLWAREMQRSLDVAPAAVRSQATIEALVLRGTGSSRDGLIVTREQMSGGVVEGEGAAYRVTLATVERGPGGWAVTRWEPQA